MKVGQKMEKLWMTFCGQFFVGNSEIPDAEKMTQN
jgi:hypothetical protein